MRRILTEQEINLISGGLRMYDGEPGFGPAEIVSSSYSGGDLSVGYTDDVGDLLWYDLTEDTYAASGTTSDGQQIIANIPAGAQGNDQAIQVVAGFDRDTVQSMSDAATAMTVAESTLIAAGTGYGGAVAQLGPGASTALSIATSFPTALPSVADSMTQANFNYIYKQAYAAKFGVNPTMGQ